MVTERYASPREILQGLTIRLREMVEDKTDGSPFHLALSGGHTAMQLFSLWKEEYATGFPWQEMRFYWADERCVPPGHPDSNYGQAHRHFLAPLRIPAGHVFRIRGEGNPKREALRYASQVLQDVPQRNGLPVFDCIILGAGADGHTASLFPGDKQALLSEQPYVATTQPQTMQRRISLSGKALLNHSPILLPLVGQGKKEIAERLASGKDNGLLLPAAYILAHAKDARLYY